MRPIVFDGELAFLGGAVAGAVARPGELVSLHTCWRRVATARRQFEMRLRLLDPHGAVALDHTRDLGYLFHPPHAWPPGESMREDYRLVLPDDLPAGDYRLVLSMTWRGKNVSGTCVPDDSTRYAAETGIELGRVRVVDR